MHIVCHKQSVCIPEKLLPQSNQLQQRQRPFNGLWSGTTFTHNFHPLTPTRIIVLPLSSFSICNGPWHPLYSADLQICVNVGRSTSFQCMISNLLNRAQWLIHVLSPVTKRWQHSSLSRVCEPSSSWDEATRQCRSCALRLWETQRADTFNTWKLSGIIYSTLTVEMFNSFAIALTPLHFSFQNQLSIAAADNWFVASEGRLEHG